MMAKNIVNVCLATSVCVGLSSCWFNSAGYIFDKAHYQAASDPKDIKPGDSVYESSGRYYVKLPRYKTGTGPQIMYPNGNNKERHVADGEQVFQIPAEYASYLTGKGGPTTPDYLKPADDKIIASATSTSTVTQTPTSQPTKYDYTSPNAVWLDTAGVFEVMCVDLPISLTISSLAIVGVTGITLCQQQMNDMNALRNAPPCEACGGAGGWDVPVTVTVRDGFGNYKNSYDTTEYKTCSRCDGTGKEGGAALKAKGQLRRGILEAILKR